MSSVVAGAGISLGTVALVGGVIAVAGIAYLIYKNNQDKMEKLTLEKMISKEDRYNGDKNIILKAIEEEDWLILEEILNDKSIKDFPDLINLIKKALEDRK
ncbi:MAG: hypothetical protein M0P43_07715 [Arcobacteraceae bacterium]|nr:hypothetical protein [Arcobacteraceae bacterium]